MMCSTFLNYDMLLVVVFDGLAVEDVFMPGPDESGEFKVEDILDMRVSQQWLSLLSYIMAWLQCF